MGIGCDLPTKGWLRHLGTWDVVRAGNWQVRDAGGSRTHFNRVAAGWQTVWLQRQGSQFKRRRQESNLVYDLRGVACEVRHTPTTNSSPSRNRTWSNSFGSWHAVRHTHGLSQYPDPELNQDQDLRSVLCCPLHHRDARADDWIRTSMNRFTRPAPFCVEPRRRQRVSEGSRTHTSCFTGRRAYRVHHGHHRQRKERGSNPQGICKNARPASNRLPSPIG